MPYHGYIVPSKVQDRLYAALKTNIPQHVTLLPIINQEEIVGILYMERKKVDDLSEIPPLSRIELQWDMLLHLFNNLYRLQKGNVIPMTQP